MHVLDSTPDSIVGYVEKEVNAWDEISQAISAKKDQLNKESSGRGTWPNNRALRSSALGPTMAILRARNDI